MNFISYYNLHLASTVYEEGFGYKRVEVPWWTTQEISDLTKPKNANESYHLSANQKVLVASGEQSFLYLLNKGQLPLGRYQTITPCFRNEPIDSYHQKHFMKLELIDVVISGVIQPNVELIASQAIHVFRKLAPDVTFEMVQTNVFDPIGFPGTYQLDVVAKINGKEIEVGSYGARTVSFATWIYGTGLAEPRFSRAIREALR